MGFGEPANKFGNSPFISSFSGDDLIKNFQFNFDADSLSVDKFDFKLPEGQGFGQAKSRIKILRDDRKPLVIEDGKVIEGGDDYTKEELDEIQKNNQNDLFSKREFPGFNFNGNDDIAQQMKKMQEQIDLLMKHNKLENENSIDKDLQDSKKELEKAKKELEEARKELKKSKSSLKTQKA
jgi:valyl-tRNA synthetase